MPRAAVVGAGPVGCLAALGLAQRGFQVDVYESRGPIEHRPSPGDGSRQRSINLAISTRGLSGLNAVDERLGKVVLQNAVPMHARMIHSVDGHQMSQAYGIHGESINSVSRTLLNALVVEHATAHDNIQMHYHAKLKSIDLSHNSAGVKLQLVDGSTHDANLMVGCDGLHSIVRSEMAKAIRMDFSQSYIDNQYVELHIPPQEEEKGLRSENGSSSCTKFALDPNHLHIWPRHDFMLIALANQDHSFTSTLFAPEKVYRERLSSPSAILDFFDQHFPDVVDLIGREFLVRDIIQRRPSPLATIKCKPYHYQGKAILLGDASHAMVPFYGQGLNCGLEDVRILLDCIDEATREDDGMSDASQDGFGNHSRADSGVSVTKRLQKTREARPPSPATLEKAFSRYSSSRHADLVAISELTLDNYYEMCSKVVSRSYLVRKKVDNILMACLPNGWWSSLYTMVTFSNQGYHEVRERERWQSALLGRLGYLTVGVSGGVGLAALALLGLRGRARLR